MKFVIGTNNQVKIEAISKVIKDVIESSEYDVEGYDVPSGVPVTPFNEQTVEGARNRVTALHKMSLAADYYVGLESGIVERYGNLYEEAWCVIKSKNKTVSGYSSGLRLPDYIVKRMKAENLQHYEVMRLLRSELGHPNDKDTWGNYSHKMLVRRISFEEATRNALVQLFAPTESLYHKLT